VPPFFAAAMVKNDTPLTLGSLFAGIGGFDLGFERAGFRTLWACEVDAKCRQVLAKKFPEATQHDDVATFVPDNFECPTAITFGSPCQDLSIAGKRAGLDGSRSVLFYEATRIIRGHVARGLRFAVWENVPGALSSNGGGDFAMVLRELAKCGAVDICWRILDAQWFGVAQRRRRLFVVADFREKRAGQVLSFAESVQGHPPPRREKGEGVAGDVAGSVRGKSRHGLDSRGAYIPENTTPTLTPAYGTKWGLDNQHIDQGMGLFVPEVCGPLTDGAHHGGGMNGQDAYSGRIFAVHTRQDPITAKDHTPPLDNSQPQGVAVTEGITVRRLTPRECERLQGFPDDWTKGHADGPRYRMLGNAVTVTVAEWIGRGAAKALEGCQ